MYYRVNLCGVLSSIVYNTLHDKDNLHLSLAVQSCLLYFLRVVTVIKTLLTVLSATYRS